MSLLDWSGKAVFAILDQGLFAGSGFIVNILLARWLPAESYGAFAIAYSLFLFLSTFYTQLLPGPLLVFGGGKYADGFRRYVAILVYGHAAVTAAVSVVLLIAAGVMSRFGSAHTVQALVGLAAAAPFILFLWLARFALYARLEPQWAMMGSALYLAMITCGLYGLSLMGVLSPVSAVLLMGGTSVLVGALLMAILKPQWDQRLVALGREPVAPLQMSPGQSTPLAVGESPQSWWDLRLVFRDHYQYAKWSSPASAASWLVTNLHYFVLNSTGGLASVAAVRVLDTALSPFLNIQTAMSRLLVAVLGSRSRQSAGDLFGYVIRISALWGCLAVVAYALVRSFAPNILALLYGHAYSQYGPLLQWYGLVLIATTIGEPVLALLRVLLRNDLIFLYQAVFALSLMIGYLFAAKHGLSGVIVVLIAVNFCILPIGLLSARGVCSSGSRMPEKLAVPGLAE